MKNTDWVKEEAGKNEVFRKENKNWLRKKGKDREGYLEIIKKGMKKSVKRKRDCMEEEESEDESTESGSDTSDESEKKTKKRKYKGSKKVAKKRLLTSEESS